METRQSQQLNAKVVTQRDLMGVCRVCKAGGKLKNSHTPDLFPPLVMICPQSFLSPPQRGWYGLRHVIQGGEGRDLECALIQVYHQYCMPDLYTCYVSLHIVPTYTLNTACTVQVLHTYLFGGYPS